MLNTVEKDEILLKVIKVVVQKSPVKDATQFIKQIRGEPSKVSFNFHPLLYFIGKQHVHQGGSMRRAEKHTIRFDEVFIEKQKMKMR